MGRDGEVCNARLAAGPCPRLCRLSTFQPHLPHRTLQPQPLHVASSFLSTHNAWLKLIPYNLLHRYQTRVYVGSACDLGWVLLLPADRKIDLAWEIPQDEIKSILRPVST